MKRFKIISVLICLLSVIPCMGATIIVDANTANPSAHFHNIKDAIGYANDDVIVVAPGAYTGASNCKLDFLGKAITLRSTNPNDPNIVATTIIDCQNSDRAFLFWHGEDSNSIVDGFTITNGRSSSGSGMIIFDSSPTIKNCVFSGNNSTNNTSGGAGIYNNNSSPVISNCTFVNNSAQNGGYGGGIYNCNNSSPIIRNCVFSGNNSSSGSGIYSSNSSPTVENCIFTDNNSTSSGAAMSNILSAGTIINCTFADNLTDGAGGAIYGFNSSPTIENCVFNGNNGTNGGAMYNYTMSSPKLSNCCFIGNSAAGNGGAMYNRENSHPSINNCTFSGNSAGSTVGGIYNYDNSSPTIVNCILWGNNPVEIDNELNSNPIVSYSDVKDGYTGITNISVDPLFVDPNVGDYHLQANSPCIDVGDPCGVYTGQMDIDKQPRVFGDLVDMGSDEAWPDIEITPSELEYDFGNVDVGTSALTIVTISNVGNAGLTVSGIGFTADSSSDFSITAGADLPATIEPNELLNVNITYSPSVEEYVAAVLEITSDDPDEPLVQVLLGGEGVLSEEPPEGQIAAILELFDDGTLVGSGPGNSAEGRLGALRNMIEAAGDLIEAGFFKEGCQQLRDAYRRTDGEPRPPDFVSGPAATQLAEMIQNLRLYLECE